MANTETKPRTNVETGLYKRKSLGGTDGLGPYTDHRENQFPEDKHSPGYDNETKGWVRGDDVGRGGGAPGITDNRPNFDRDKSRKGNDAPSSKGGRESFPSPFSAAGRNIK